MKQENFGMFDIPLSCSVFLEPALIKYAKNITPLPGSMLKFINKWNINLIDTMSYAGENIGAIGRKILSNTITSTNFPTNCVERARSVPLHSLHYAIRFSESINFLTKKIQQNPNIKFVDLGCGFSPMAPVIQKEYNLGNVYCIDTPEITKYYQTVAMRTYGRAPTAITWNDAKDMVKSGALDTIVAMGVLPYMDIQDQISRLKFINANFQNFLVEIKYNNTDPTDEKVFDLKTLQKLRMSVENAQTLETTMIKNSLRYLHKFIYTVPNKRYFIASNRSLFLSR